MPGRETSEPACVRSTSGLLGEQGRGAGRVVMAHGSFSVFGFDCFFFAGGRDAWRRRRHVRLRATATATGASAILDMHTGTKHQYSALDVDAPTGVPAPRTRTTWRLRPTDSKIEAGGAAASHGARFAVYALHVAHGAP